MKCEEANRISIVDYLSRLGYQPKRISRMDHWYLSPLREETSPSFKVNAAKNCWYDHGLGKGGTLIDFVMLLDKCDVSLALQKLNSSVSGHAAHRATNFSSIKKNADLPKNEIVETSLQIIRTHQPLSDRWLFYYAKQRNINAAVLNKWCCEVSFKMHNKEYKAIGFKNDNDGYELRNNWFKGSSSPKAPTLIENNAPELAVFEGFFDFLSFQSVCIEADLLQPDIMVLNSLSFFESNFKLMKEYKQANLFLDNDPAGRKWTAFALEQSTCFQDKSALYLSYKDLNEWHVNFGKKQSVKLHFW